MTREQASDIIGFLQSHRPERAPFVADQLPDVPYPTVSFHRETLVGFRARYADLLAFSAAICDTTVETLCGFDMMGALWKKAATDEDRDRTLRSATSEARTRTLEEAADLAEYEGEVWLARKIRALAGEGR